MNLTDIKDLYTNQACYIVGKGPSLEFLSSSYFVNSIPVICLNDSIIVVEQLRLSNPIYSLQKDGDFAHMVKPSDETILILQNTKGYSKDFYPEHPKRMLVDPVADMGFDLYQTMAIRMAIWITLYMGCNHIDFLSCDSLVSDDLRTFNARNRSSMVTGAGNWYRLSRHDVLNDLRDISHKFITPSKEKL